MAIILTPEQVASFRRQGLSYREIASRFNTNPGVVYRIYRTGKGEKIGSKKKGRIYPIWELINPEWIYVYAKKIAGREYPGYSREYLNLQDYLIDFAYSLYPTLQRLSFGAKGEMLAYIYKAMYNKKEGYKKLKEVKNVELRKTV